MTHIFKPKAGLALLLLVASFLLVACKDSPADLIRSARDYQAKGDHQAAVIQLKNVLQQQPDNGEARLMLGRSNLVVGDAATAEKEFRKALEYGQAPATVVPLIAEAMLQEGRADKVVSEFGATKLDDAQADAELKQQREIETVRAREQAEIERVKAEERLRAQTAIVPASTSKSLHRSASSSERRSPVAINRVIGSVRSRWRQVSEDLSLASRSRSWSAVSAWAPSGCFLDLMAWTLRWS